MNSLWIVLIIAAECIWLGCLVSHLKNRNQDPTDKICWTIVLCVLNLLGLILFVLAGPEDEYEGATEEQLKKAFNEGRR